MSYKETFLNSLNDDQLGFFCAHEYDANLEELLQDTVTVKQFGLFTEWKKHEAQSSTQNLDSVKLDHLLSKIDTLKSLFVNMKAQHASSAQNLDSVKLDSLLSKIDTLASLFTKMATRVDDLESRLVSDLTQMKESQKSMESNITTEHRKMRRLMDNQLSTISMKLNEVAKEEQKTKQELTQIREDQNRIEHRIVAEQGKSEEFRRLMDNQLSTVSMKLNEVAKEEQKTKQELTQIREDQNRIEHRIVAEQGKSEEFRRLMDNQLSTVSMKLNEVAKEEQKTKQELTQIRGDQNRMEHRIVAEQGKGEEFKKQMEDQFSAVIKKIDKVDEIEYQTVQLCLSNLHTFESEKLCKKWLQNLLSQVNDSKIAKEKEEELGSKENIEKTVTIMEKYAGNEEIEIMASSLLANFSYLPVPIHINIVESGCAEYLKDLNISDWPKRNTKEITLNNLYAVFLNLTCDSETRHHVLKDCYFQLFQLPFSDTEFSQYNILAGNMVCNFSMTNDEEWNTKLTKEEAENALLNNMGSWQLGKFNPTSFSSLDFYLTSISTGTNAQKRYWAWFIANVLTMEPSTYVAMLKKEGGILKIYAILANTATDAEVRRLVQISLNILNK